MVLKYTTALSVPMLVISIVALGFGIVNGPTLSILSGSFVTVLSILMLFRPMVILSPTEIDMKNLLGLTMRRYELHSDNHQVAENKIWVDGRKRVALWMFDADEATVRDYLDG